MKEYEITEENFLEELRKVNPDLDFTLLRRAFDFSARAHNDQIRDSGEPYLFHPLMVSYLLTELGSDSSTIAAGLLHDILEDTNIKLDALQKEFGKEIASLVDGVTKIDSYPYRTKISRPQIQAENYRKLLISVTRDVRVIIIKLADRLHNMRTLNFLNRERRCRIAQETLDIYAPLARHFGIAVFQWELEDLSFKNLHPAEYRHLVKLVAAKKTERDEYINNVIETIKILLQKNQITAEIAGRTKHFYSIYLKNKAKRSRFEDILDLVGIRIITDTITDCYRILGILQTRFTPIPGKFKDYIIKPKFNNYQSLHLNVEDDQGNGLEIQIRTRGMHMIAEEGIAAHWRYKQEYNNIPRDRKGMPVIQLQNNLQQQINLIRSLVNKQVNEDPEHFLETLKLNLYPDIVVVRTPADDYIKLRKHSTTLDFAFKIHSDIGFRCIGAEINGKHVPVRTELQTGDIVRILTSPQGKPSRDWLNFIRSPKARQKIRSHFHKIDFQTFIDEGRHLFFKRIRKLPCKIKQDEDILKIARALKINDLKTFYAQLGNGELDFSSVKSVILPKKVESTPMIDQEQILVETEPAEVKENLNLVVLQDIDAVMIRFAKCCNPKPGDDIIGYTTRGRGITVHRVNCSNSGFLNLLKLEPERILKLKWR